MSKSHQIKIIGLEQSLEMPLEISGLEFPVSLRGKLDRVDEVDGQLRILDYKTGKVTQPEVELVEWEDLITDYGRSKAFQLLCYALMFNAQQPIGTINAGIISFKNLRSGVLLFASKDKKGSRTKDTVITAETLSTFETYLKELILEICNPEIAFKEKQV